MPYQQKEKRNYVRAATYSTYVVLLNRHILPEFGQLIKVEESEVQEFILRKLSEGLSHDTVREAVLVLKMILRYGHSLGLCQRPDWILRYPTPRQATDLKIMRTEDVFRILDTIRANPDGKGIGIYITLYSGLRIGEICALQWGDLDLRTGMLHVRRTLERVYLSDAQPPRCDIGIGPPKTPSSAREIPLADHLLELLRAFGADKKDPGHFVLSDGPKPLEPRCYRNYFAHLLDSHGIPRIRFHALRHSFATRCIEKGADYKTVSSLLGHSDVKTTLNLYVHPGMDQKKACVNNLR